MPCCRFASNLFALAVSCAIVAITPAVAADEVTITHSKAVAGGVTPGDGAGYPVTLSQPGSYRLAGNLEPTPGRDGIVVTSPDVTIDLNGFRISGGPAGGANNARYGIVAQNDRLTVKNGTIGAFKGAGVQAPGVSHLIVENVRVINGNKGIYNTGSFGRIRNSTIAVNTGNGVQCGVSCHVEGNIVSNNGGIGLLLVSGTVLGNAVFANTLLGIANVGIGAVGFAHNTVYDNNSVGGGIQTDGPLHGLDPNACQTAC